MSAFIKLHKFVGLFAGLAGFTLLTIYISDWWTDGPTKRAGLNGDIFPAFRAIEVQCRSESSRHQTVRCANAIELDRSCRQAPDNCTSEKYYCSLVKLGFDDELPPYYRVGTRYHGTSPC